jgi:hypothetical protein
MGRIWEEAMPVERKYDVAFSFAGEESEVPLALAKRLREAGYSVFDQKHDEADLWGEDLIPKLQDVYQNLSRFCVMFISKTYARKDWTHFELQAALSRALIERTAYILPIRIDDTVLPGLSSAVAYLDFTSEEPGHDLKSKASDVYDLLTNKLGSPIGRTGKELPVTVDKIRDVLAACYRRAVFAKMHAQMDWDAMFSSLSECRATLQRLVAYIEPVEAQRLVASVIGELDLIERIDKSGSRYADPSKGQIDNAKLRIIAALLALRDLAQVSFVLPTSLTQEVFFTAEEASKQPNSG